MMKTYLDIRYHCEYFVNGFCCGCAAAGSKAISDADS